MVPDPDLKLHTRTGMKADTAKTELVIAINSPPPGRSTQRPNRPKFNLGKLAPFLLIHLRKIFVDWMNGEDLSPCIRNDKRCVVLLIGKKGCLFPFARKVARIQYGPLEHTDGGLKPTGIDKGPRIPRHNSGHHPNQGKDQKDFD